MTSLIGDSTLAMRSVNMLVMCNILLHAFCMLFNLSACVLVTVSVAEAAWLRVSYEAVRSRGLAMTTGQLHMPIGMSANTTCTQSLQLFVPV